MSTILSPETQRMIASLMEALDLPVAVFDQRFNLVFCHHELKQKVELKALEESLREKISRSLREGVDRGVVNGFTEMLEVVTRSGTTAFKVSVWSPENEQSEFFLIRLHKTGTLEEELAEMKSKCDFYKVVLDNLPSDIAVFDQHHRYLYLNHHAIKNEEIRNWLIGKDDFDYVRHRNLPLSIAENRRARFNHLVEEKLKQYSFEETMERDGMRTTNLRIMKAMHDEYGRFNMAVGYGLNISQLKDYETRIKNQEIAIEISPDGIAILNNEGLYTYLNDAHVRMYGFEKQEELIGKSWKELYSAEEISRIEQQIFPLLLNEGTWSGETIGMNRLTGKEIHTEISLTFLPDQGMVCICRDISERKRRDKNYQQLAVVASKTGSMVIITDTFARIEWVNDAFLKKTGYTIEEVLGKYPGELLDGPDTDPEVILQLKKATQTKVPFSGEKLSYMKDGSKIWFYLNATPIFNEEGDLVNWVSVETDITLLKVAEDRILNALNKERNLSELKSRFVSMASHEFRTPLAGIMTSIDLVRILLERSSVNYDVRIEFHLERAMEEIERMTSIMDNILLFGKMQTGHVLFQPQRGDFHEFIKLQAAEFRMRFPERKINLKTDCSVIMASFDHKLMQHIITNLLNNAVKYSPDHTSIDLAVSCSDDRFRVSITDYGIGIPEAEQHLLFSSFFRASNTENVSGTGMGLVIVKQFMDLHKGEITISSKESQGCNVQILFPKDV